MEKYFKKGAKVEVMSDDEGFKGSWFVGTVVQKLKNGKVLVEYHTLTQDDGGKKKLREEFDLLYLRPVPPPEPPRERGFEISEEVDAYYNDGWWEGVIIEVLKQSRYSVYFKGTRDQLEFEESELRVHREWDGENWVPPFETETRLENKSETKVKPEKIGEMHFYKGASVEVSSDEDGFVGAWFSATIKEILDQDKYLIEYESLMDDDGMRFLREEVDGQHIRPCPPEIIDNNNFKPFDEVDALYNDGWWVGIICEVLENQRYRVYFRDTDEQEEYPHSLLRVHQDWIDGKWVMLSQALKL